MSTEIERKWAVGRLPPLAPGHRLDQGYLARDGDVEVRLRSMDGQWRLTIKAGHGLSRTEVEVALTTADGEALWRETGGRRLQKMRHRVEIGPHVAEVDVYQGDLAGLAVVEVEFGSEADATSFVAPDWFGPELTGDPRWSNASLAERGRPA